MSHPTKGDDRPKKRQIRLILSPRDKADNAAALREIRDALRAAGTHALRVEQTEDDPRPSALHRNLDLELKIGNGVRLKLDVKDAAMKAGDAPAIDPKKAEEIKKSLAKWLGEKAKVGWRVTVSAVLEWLSKRSAG